jgi:hypothetical protein
MRVVVVVISQPEGVWVCLHVVNYGHVVIISDCDRARCEETCSMSRCCLPRSPEENSSGEFKLRRSDVKWVRELIIIDPLHNNYLYN